MMVLQEKWTDTNESAFRGETVRKLSGCKLLAMALSKDLTFLFGDISVAFMNTPIPEGDPVYV